MNIILKIGLILMMTGIGSIGALFFKRGTAKLKNGNIMKILFVPEIYIGGVSYVAGALINIILLRYMDYTLVYPMTSITYIWTMLISCFILKEKLTGNKILAIICIVLGVLVMNI